MKRQNEILRQLLQRIEATKQLYTYLVYNLQVVPISHNKHLNTAKRGEHFFWFFFDLPKDRNS